MSKILFVYPNKEGYPIIPLGISVLAGILKREQHDIDLFDITFMMPERLDHHAREKTGMVKKVDVTKYWGTLAGAVNIQESFKQKLLSFKPDVIAFSIVENNYGCARELFRVAKQTIDSLIIAGGIFPTVAPDFFINDENVDMLCIGEGEFALTELARRLDGSRDFSDIPNLIVKNQGHMIRNTFNRFYNWEPFTLQEWDIFDQRHLLKPFIGKMWRTGFFEMSRGCPFHCSYCANDIYQNIFKSLGSYHREKPVEYLIREIEHMKKQYALELVFFNDENFMMMRDERLREFCTKFKTRVNLPFFIQARADTLLDEEKIKLLKESQCATIGIGVETGNEKLRRELLGKPLANEVYLKAFANCKKFDVRTTAYVMMGLPYETPEDILKTAEFCRNLKAESVALSIFAPYHGSTLYKICVEAGFISDGYHEDISVNYSTILNMPQLSRERLETLYYQFNDLVFGKEGERHELQLQ